VQRHRVAVREHSPDERRRHFGDVPIDEKERRRDAFARQQVQQVRCRRRIRAVVEGQVDGRRRALRHVPHRPIAGDDVKKKGRGRRVGEDEDAEADRDGNPHNLNGL
jgi:hypothetical protein